jgi:hypothetical protein
MLIKMKVLAVVAGVAVFAGVSASAATLGGLKTDDVGANSNVVAPHLTGGVSVSFTTVYSTTLGYYTVTAASLQALTAGDTIAIGAKVQVTFKGGLTSLGEVTINSTAAAMTNSVPLTITLATPIAAADLTGVSLVVNGGAITAVNATAK